MEVREWIASMSISRRRKMLTKALAEWEARGKHHPDFELISPFVKKELLAYFGRDKKSGSINGGKVRYIPRLIQAPHDETHLIAGPYLKPLVKTLKLAWNEKFWIFYASVGPQQLNAWLASIAKCKSFFWSDYTAFDSTFSEHTWKMIEGFYRHIYPNAEMDFWKVLDIWRRPKGRAFVRKQRAVVEYTADVAIARGEMTLPWQMPSSMDWPSPARLQLLWLRSLFVSSTSRIWNERLRCVRSPLLGTIASSAATSM
jgi:hypothetical protein